MSLTGIDIPIATLRQSFADNLWTSVLKKTFYTRVFRNLNRNNELIGEVFSGGVDYEEVHFDDRLNVLCFFDIGDTVSNIDPNEQTTEDVGIVFSIKLISIYPNLSRGPAIETVYTDVLDVINDTSALSVTPNEIIRGLPAYGDLSTTGLVAYNNQPWHTFRINTTMKLNYDCSQDLNLSDPYPDPISN